METFLLLESGSHVLEEDGTDAVLLESSGSGGGGGLAPSQDSVGLLIGGPGIRIGSGPLVVGGAPVNQFDF